MIRLVPALMLVAVTAACTSERVWAPDVDVQRAVYANDGPSTLTLYTVVNNRTGGGAHTALAINGRQRVLWDPAGSFHLPFAPERNDLFYGFSPRVQAIYEDYHARETFRVVAQTVEVPPDVADRAITLAMQAGPTTHGACASSTTRILRQLPGFEGIRQTFYPTKAMEAFSAFPGVTERVVTDDDADDNHGVLIVDDRPVNRTLEQQGR